MSMIELIMAAPRADHVEAELLRPELKLAARLIHRRPEDAARPVLVQALAHLGEVHVEADREAHGAEVGGEDGRVGAGGDAQVKLPARRAHLVVDARDLARRGPPARPSCRAARHAPRRSSRPRSSCCGGRPRPTASVVGPGIGSAQSPQLSLGGEVPLRKDLGHADEVRAILRGAVDHLHRLAAVRGLLLARPRLPSAGSTRRWSGERSGP
jgi:hypothetical protein